MRLLFSSRTGDAGALGESLRCLWRSRDLELADAPLDVGCAGRAVSELLATELSSSKKKLEAGKLRSSVGADVFADAGAGVGTVVDADAGARGGTVGTDVDFCGVGAARAAALARSASRSSIARLYVSAIVSGLEVMLLSASMPFESGSCEDSGLRSSTTLGGAGKSGREAGLRMEAVRSGTVTVLARVLGVVEPVIAGAGCVCNVEASERSRSEDGERDAADGTGERLEV